MKAKIKKKKPIKIPSHRKHSIEEYRYIYIKSKKKRRKQQQKKQTNKKSKQTKKTTHILSMESSFLLLQHRD